MTTRINALLPLLVWVAAFLVVPIAGHAQRASNCQFPLFPWLCDNNQLGPSPGFPGSGTPFYPLPTVPITGTPSSGGMPYFPYQVIPVMPFPMGPGPFTPTAIPCPGNPLVSMQIAPSKPGNYRGGTFGYTRNNNQKFHEGIDLAAEPGTPVFSMYDGLVSRIETRFAPNQYSGESATAYGNFVEVTSIINGQTIVFKYAHLNSVGAGIAPGTKVLQGNSLGNSGRTGNAARNGVVPHVHLRTRTSSGGKVDPAPYVGTKFNTSTGQITNKPC
jgi:murein DD-endopeptidase MepM/ murein hydrolase activator NlpD